jgi:hypothetical protein
MNRKIVTTGRRLVSACIPFLAFWLSMPATADSPKPGGYCPGTDILLVSAEELSASLDQAMRSRTALINKDQTTAFGELTSAGATLHLAASRGAAARTILLIDAVIQARAGEDYAQTLAWFPLLQASLLTLPDDATARAAGDLIGGAEGILQGDKDGDPVAPLKEARHMLACDGLDIPLRNAMEAQENLLKQLSQNTKTSAYDTLMESLRSALAYALEGREE